MIDNSDEKIIQALSRHTDLKNTKMLEIGCGSGRISSRLYKYSPALVAIDPDEKAILQAQKNFPEINFCVGSGEKLDFVDAAFDVSIFTLSLHHQESAQALKEAARVTKNGGKICVIEPVIGGEVEQIFSYVCNEDKEKEIAQQAIRNCGLPLIVSELFTAQCILDDKEDLLRSLFGYYNMPYNDEAIEKITAYLGDRIDSTPIELEDKMSLHILLVNEQN